MHSLLYYNMSVGFADELFHVHAFRISRKVTTYF